METNVLSAAQRRVMRAFALHGRCVGATRTDESVGFVHTGAARWLAGVGLLEEETSATGAKVFTLTNEGRELLWANGLEHAQQ